MLEKISKPLNDGIMEFGKVTTIRDSTKTIVGENFESKGTMFFENAFIRNQDFDIFGTSDNTESLKVKTYYVHEFKKIAKQKVKIEEEIFNVHKIDPTNDKRFMYWYLQKVSDKND